MKNKTKLSVNIDKIALVRNSRNKEVPNLKRAVQVCFDSGCKSVTMHPRADNRHCKIQDIYDISCMKIFKKGYINLNIEGDLRDDLLKSVIECNVFQFTIVPVIRVNEKTTQRGWVREYDGDCYSFVQKLRKVGVKVFVFSDTEEDSIKYIKSVGADGVELHTKQYANSFYDDNKRDLELNKLLNSAKLAQSLGLLVNIGHDLNLYNLKLLIDNIDINEVSIGHELISESIFCGLENSIRSYIDILNK